MKRSDLTHIPRHTLFLTTSVFRRQFTVFRQREGKQYHDLRSRILILSVRRTLSLKRQPATDRESWPITLQCCPDSSTDENSLMRPEDQLMQ